MAGKTTHCQTGVALVNPILLSGITSYHSNHKKQQLPISATLASHADATFHLNV